MELTCLRTPIIIDSAYPSRGKKGSKGKRKKFPADILISCMLDRMYKGCMQGKGSLPDSPDVLLFHLIALGWREEKRGGKKLGPAASPALKFPCGSRLQSRKTGGKESITTVLTPAILNIFVCGDEPWREKKEKRKGENWKRLNYL